MLSLNYSYSATVTNEVLKFSYLVASSVRRIVRKEALGFGAFIRNFTSDICVGLWCTFRRFPLFINGYRRLKT